MIRARGVSDRGMIRPSNRRTHHGLGGTAGNSRGARDHGMIRVSDRRTHHRLGYPGTSRSVSDRGMI